MFFYSTMQHTLNSPFEGALPRLTEPRPGGRICARCCLGTLTCNRQRPAPGEWQQQYARPLQQPWQRGSAAWQGCRGPTGGRPTPSHHAGSTAAHVWPRWAGQHTGIASCPEYLRVCGAGSAWACEEGCKAAEVHLGNLEAAR